MPSFAIGGVSMDTQPPRKRMKVCDQGALLELFTSNWEEDNLETTRQRRSLLNTLNFSRYTSPKKVHDCLGQLFKTEDMILYLRKLPNLDQELHQSIMKRMREERTKLAQEFLALITKKPELLDLPKEILVLVLSKLPSFTDLFRARQVCRTFKEAAWMSKLSIAVLDMADVFRFNSKTCLRHVDRSLTSLEIVYSTRECEARGFVKNFLAGLPGLTAVKFTNGRFDLVNLPPTVTYIDLQDAQEDDGDDDEPEEEEVINDATADSGDAANDNTDADDSDALQDEITAAVEMLEWVLGDTHRALFSLAEMNLLDETMPKMSVQFIDGLLEICDYEKETPLPDSSFAIPTGFKPSVVPHEVILYDINLRKTFKTFSFACGGKGSLLNEYLAGCLTFDGQSLFRSWRGNAFRIFAQNCRKAAEEYLTDKKQWPVLKGFQREVLEDRVRLTFYFETDSSGSAPENAAQEQVEP